MLKLFTALFSILYLLPPVIMAHPPEQDVEDEDLTQTVGVMTRWTNDQFSAHLQHFQLSETGFINNFPIVRTLEAAPEATMAQHLRHTVRRFPIPVQIRLLGRYMVETRDMAHISLRSGIIAPELIEETGPAWSERRFSDLLAQFALTEGIFRSHFPFQHMSREEARALYPLLPTRIMNALHHQELSQIHAQRLSQIHQRYLLTAQTHVAETFHPRFIELPARTFERLAHIRFDDQDSHLDLARKFLRIGLILHGEEIEGLDQDLQNMLIGKAFSRAALSFMLARLTVAPFPLTFHSALSLCDPATFDHYQDLTSSALQTLSWASRYLPAEEQQKLARLTRTVIRQDVFVHLTRFICFINWPKCLHCGLERHNSAGECTS